MPSSMPQRTFSKSGPKVGAMGFGAMSFGGFYGPATEEESQQALAAALETGTTHWDVSDVYGMGLCEEIIGRFLKAHPSARGKIHLATKGGIKRTAGSNVRTFDNSPEYFRTALEASLKRLGVDHIDLYYVHRREQARPVEEVADTMARFIKEGKIKGYGLSEVAPSTVRRAHAVHPVMAVQSEYSLWSRLPELGLLQACHEIGAAFVAFSPLARAFLCGTVRSIEGFGPSDFRKANPRFIEPNFSANLKAIAPFLALAKRKGCTPGQLAPAWVLAQGDHIVPIPGSRFAKNVVENAGAAMLKLTADDLGEIARILPPGFAHGARYSDAQQVGVELYG
jgi:aryl-alcohol dehydrogenase-like predicted oxidoreductase